MARGQKQAADRNLALTNQQAGIAGANAAAERAPLISGYEGMIRGGGYDQATKNAMTGTAYGSANEAYDTAGASAGGRVARTRNDAGYLDSLDSLARGRAQTLASTGAGLQKNFADEAIRQREAGLRGLAGLYGIDEETMARLYGLGPSTLGARAAGGGWSQGFRDVADAFKPNVSFAGA